MITDKEIESACKNYFEEFGLHPTELAITNWKNGAHFAQKTMLERASKGFEDFWGGLEDDRGHQRSPAQACSKRAWQAAVLSKEAEIAELKAKLDTMECGYESHLEDYREEVSALKSRLEKQDAQIREADSLAEFYGDKHNWQFRGSTFRKDDCDEISPGYHYGKRARAYLEKYKNGGIG